MGEWYESVELWGVVISAIIGISMFIITRNMNNNQKSKNETEALFKVFSLLSSPDVRGARRTIHHHNKFDKTKPLELESIPVIQDECDLVLSSYDQVSILVLKKIVNYELFFELYGQMAVRDYMRLQKEIKKDKTTIQKLSSIIPT
jgi:hypothetical protein